VTDLLASWARLGCGLLATGNSAASIKWKVQRDASLARVPDSVGGRAPASLQIGVGFNCFPSVEEDAQGCLDEFLSEEKMARLRSFLDGPGWMSKGGCFDMRCSLRPRLKRDSLERPRRIRCMAVALEATASEAPLRIWKQRMRALRRVGRPPELAADPKPWRE